MILHIMRVRLVCEVAATQFSSSKDQTWFPEVFAAHISTVLVEGVYGNLNNLNTLLICI